MSPGYRDVECGCRVGIGIHGERTSRVPGIWSTDVAWRADVACAWDMEYRCCMGVGMYSADIAWVLGSGVLGFGSGCWD